LVTEGLAWIMRARRRRFAVRARFFVSFKNTAAGPLVDGSVEAVRLSE
jgi:hypothetical protein